MSPDAPKPVETWLQPPVVVKVGGSLFEWPELRSELPRYISTLAGLNVILIAGGGKTADLIREQDRIHHLGDERSHWLALRALSLNAHLMGQLLGGIQVVEGINASRSAWRRGGVTILDLYRFSRGDESRRDHLPHSWDVTSDSLSARIATVAEANKLVLLKSATPPAGDWAAAAKAGYVDSYFPTAVAKADFAIEAINLREWVG